MAPARGPLQEKPALFRHGRFATGNVKVRDRRKMLNQPALFHVKGKAPLRELPRGAAADPAMLVRLDAGRNVKGNPNGNFARGILELLTLGPGDYTGTGIREAARMGGILDPGRRTGPAGPPTAADGPSGAKRAPARARAEPAEVAKRAPSC